jgi:hypothetical protein
MGREIILTHCGKLGDMLYSLPVASWLARERGCKSHWVLPTNFEPFNYIRNLLMLQPFVSRGTLVPHRVDNYDCGGQPYKFNPADFGIQGEYYNLGFRAYPNKFLPAFYAEEHGFGYDPDFRLKIYPDDPREMASLTDRALTWREGKPTEILRTREGAMAKLVPGAEPLTPAMDLLELARRLAAAKEVHTWFCGIAVLCWFAGITATVYRVPGHAAIQLYFPEPRNLTFKEVTI